MPQNEAEGRLNLYDDVTPLENTNKISVLVDAIRKKNQGCGCSRSYCSRYGNHLR